MARITVPMTPRRGPWCGRSSTPHSAGDSVRALIAERNIDTATVMANWRNSSPEMPGMNATGTNTESSTRVIAMMGAVISAIAFLVASAGDSSGCSSITRSTFSTTTIASSTTIPMASTIASSETELAEYPIANNTTKVPIRLTGTANVGIRVARTLPRKRKTTSTTRTNASIRVF